MITGLAFVAATVFSADASLHGRGRSGKRSERSPTRRRPASSFGGAREAYARRERRRNVPDVYSARPASAHRVFIGPEGLRDHGQVHHVPRGRSTGLGPGGALPCGTSPYLVSESNTQSRDPVRLTKTIIFGFNNKLINRIIRVLRKKSIIYIQKI